MKFSDEHTHVYCFWFYYNISGISTHRVLLSQILSQIMALSLLPVMGQCSLRKWTISSTALVLRVWGWALLLYEPLIYTSSHWQWHGQSLSLTATKIRAPHDGSLSNVEKRWTNMLQPHHLASGSSECSVMITHNNFFILQRAGAMCPGRP